jgi:hypothetical protein
MTSRSSVNGPEVRGNRLDNVQCHKNLSAKVENLLATCRAGPDCEFMYSSTLSLTSALDGAVGGQGHVPVPLPQERAAVPTVQEAVGN